MSGGRKATGKATSRATGRATGKATGRGEPLGPGGIDDAGRAPGCAEADAERAGGGVGGGVSVSVRLVTHTPDPERCVAIAARQCYSPLGAERLAEGLSDEKVGELIATILEAGHLSPTEHATFTFAIEGVSRALSHQLVRHRIASYSQQSQRYVDERGFEYVMPPSVAGDRRARQVFERQMEEARNAYRELAAMVPREDARYVLPGACGTRLVMTMNCRSLYNFFERRLCERAQWEIRGLARAMLGLVKAVAPRLFSWVGAPCEMRGYCPEGRLSCGKVLGSAKRLIAAADLAEDRADEAEGET